jgi:phosphohistidine phosphatase
MKRLAIFRHAKSSWDDASIDDFNRPLNERGWKSARRIGKEMKHRRMSFDLGLASPAARVRETIDGVTETYGEPKFPIRFEPRMYGASVVTLVELIRSIPADVEAALMVGHNPGFERLVAELTRDDSKGLRDRVAGKFPTAAMAVIELPAASWAEVEPGEGQVVELLLPRELD